MPDRNKVKNKNDTQRSYGRPIHIGQRHRATSPSAAQRMGFVRMIVARRFALPQNSGSRDGSCGDPKPPTVSNLRRGLNRKSRLYRLLGDRQSDPRSSGHALHDVLRPKLPSISDAAGLGGGAQPCQGWGRWFESLRPLQYLAAINSFLM
jgi:hypothetical protein